MTDELIKRIRDRASFVMQGPAHILRTANEAAALIEQQAARIAELEAQIAPVAPVDAQPVAWLIGRGDALPEATATREYADLTRRNGSKVTPLYASAQSEGFRKDAVRREALEQASALCQAIANGYVSDVNPKRSREAADAAIFCAREIAALSQHTGEKDD